MKRLALLLALAGVLLATGSYAQTNIDGTYKYAWGENIGWVNFQGDVANGVIVGDDYLSGYAWLENVGWLFLGDGTPTGSGGTQYTQAAGDTGVNHDGSGNLSGYAWGENIGWVVFDTSGSAGSQVTIDGSGNFSGYAWSENVGWINMASGYGVRTDWLSVYNWQYYY